MYAVIFKAEMNEVDEAYFETGRQMRELAIDKYGCSEFTSCNEGRLEIAVSYWQTKEQIKAWKNDPEHQKVQTLGKTKWYKSYRVQIVDILREYGN